MYSPLWYVFHVVGLVLQQQPLYCDYLIKKMELCLWKQTRGRQTPDYSVLKKIILLRVLQQIACGWSWTLLRVCPLCWLITMPLVNKVKTKEWSLCSISHCIIEQYLIMVCSFLVSHLSHSNLFASTFFHLDIRKFYVTVKLYINGI